MARHRGGSVKYAASTAAQTGGWQSLKQERHGFDRASLRKITFCLGAHAFFERAGGDREAKLVAGVGNSVGAGCVEIAVGAFGFDNERRCLAAVERAVSLRIPNVDQEFDVADHV